jgi:lysozyme family protein
MRAVLEKFIDSVIQKEGGYVNNPDDAGGETNFGITIAVAREFGYYGDMERMPRYEAVQIYAEQYWYQPQLDLIEKESSRIAEEVFDSGINCGEVTAIRWLQRALNSLNKKQRSYLDITPDGIMGEKTQEALRSFLRQRTLHGEAVLLKALNCLQGEYYIRISEKTETNETFLFGWLKNRIA